MAKTLKLNSKNAIVSFDAQDLVDYDLLKWIRATQTGISNRKISNDAPFEIAAAKVYVEANPESIVKIASKVILKEANQVDVYIKVTDKVSEGYYNKHPDKVVLKK